MDLKLIKKNKSSGLCRNYLRLNNNKVNIIDCKKIQYN